jgi:UDP-N-acetylmuramoylalanine--D-glutamate ligase
VITSPAFRGRRYAVLGLARSGLATVDALVASGAEVKAWDSNKEARARVQGKALIADPLEISLAGYDGVVVSPGVPLNTHPIAAKAREAGVPVIGDIELFAQARAGLPPHKVVGITGTNGKSTTTALVHHILKTAGIPTEMGGNIGLPILAQDPLPEGGVYVLELSSYQIDLTFSLDCDVAVLLNITPDHLDRYESFEAYAAAKHRLFELQSAGHAPVFIDDGEGGAVTRYFDSWPELFTHNEVRIEPRRLQAEVEASGLGPQSEWSALQGPHNLQNAAAAIAVARALGLREAEIEAGLRTYPGLPHRMERIAERDGVLFVDDSKATNAESTAPALAAFKYIHWIVGGVAKTHSLGPCEDQLGHVRAAYTIGKDGPMFAQLLEGRVPVTECEYLATAVNEAAGAAVSGEVVLLSPACASFDQFRDFEDRGNAFRVAVGALE